MEKSKRDVEMELEDVECIQWLVKELRSMLVADTIIQRVVGEDEIRHSK